MTDHESSAFSWVCPQCSRHVPNKLAACRCGYALPLPAELPPPKVAGPIAERRPGAGSSMVTSAVVAIAAVAGTLYWMSQRPAAPPTPAAPRPPVARVVNAPTATVVHPVAEPLTAAARVAEAMKAAEAATIVAPAVAGAPVPLAAARSGALDSLEDVISRAMPAVVRVETSGSFGSGFFVTPDTILTNVHVVSSNASVTIRRPDGTTVSGRVETTAAELDIAIVHISNPDPNQPTLRMGSGLRARAGQEVIALGTPLGLQNTVTRGIVSAVRQVGGITLVQTDAAINPGNSGGPLLDRSGDVIGITTMGMRSAVAQGLSFAIAIDYARSLLAGERPAQATGTPIASLNQAMSSGGASRSPSESARDEGTRTYEQAIAAVARRADALDDRWRNFKRACYKGLVVGSFEREWFALWDQKAMQGAVAHGCEINFNELRVAAENIHETVVTADEAARRADVYPGSRRDLLRRYHLDYAGWDR
jgi:S1-C subfamily serine protease